MTKQLKVCWLSAGVSSFIAGYLVRDTVDEFIYIDIDDQHPDSMRFIKDCEVVLGKQIQILKSGLGSVENAIRKYGYGRINTPNGAPCTGMLKRKVRKQWEQEHHEYELTYVWGFDLEEKNRADRMLKSTPEYKHEFPLINRYMTKQDAHGLLERLGIRRPMMYDMGYSNNNCIGCVRGGMGYWNKIRVDFPEVFESRAKLEREIGATCIKGVYLDELDPNRGRMEDEIMQECGIMCLLAEGEPNGT